MFKFVKTPLALLCVILIFNGCSAMKIQHFQTAAQRPEHIAHFYEVLDELIDAEGAKNAAGLNVNGFPYLRSNRFLTALKNTRVDDLNREEWIERMRQYDLTEREKEILSLSDAAVEKLISDFDLKTDRDGLNSVLADYSQTMLAHDQALDRFPEILNRSVYDPGEYLLLLRTVGLYPLFAVATKIGETFLYKEFLKWHERDLDELEVIGTVTYFEPAASRGTQSEIARILNNAPKDTFGFPELERSQSEQLFRYFAPVLAQDVDAGYDLPGTVAWKNGKVTIDTEQPAVYTYLTHSFFSGEPAVQLNYAWWFEGRRGANAPFYERGPLDGLTLRVTIDLEGNPVTADIMNSCGCYYMLIPDEKRTEHTKVEIGAEKFLVPEWLPPDYPGQQLHIRTNSGWHQVQQVYAAETPRQGVAYQLLDYETLEALPHEDGHRESVFDETGVMKDSWRVEPVVFFPAGIPRVGFMRQRGNHPIKLIGRAHFSDPFLFDGNFLDGK